MAIMGFNQPQIKPQFYNNTLVAPQMGESPSDGQFMVYYLP